MPNLAPIFSNPAILTTLGKHWCCQDEEPPLTHAATGRYLSPSQFMSFLLAARGDPYRSCAALLTCSLLTGIPATELREAYWIDVDTKGGTLVVTSEITNSLECHTLTQPACRFLERWEQGRFSSSSLIFELDGNIIDMDTLTDTLNVLGRMAGIDGLTFDDLVRSYDYIALVEALHDIAPSDCRLERFVDEVTGQVLYLPRF